MNKKRATHVVGNIKAKGRASVYAAWFNGHPFAEDSSLLGAERTDKLGRVYDVTPKQWGAIERSQWHGDMVSLPICTKDSTLTFEPVYCLREGIQ